MFLGLWFAVVMSVGIVAEILISRHFTTVTDEEN